MSRPVLSRPATSAALGVVLCVCAMAGALLVSPRVGPRPGAASLDLFILADKDHRLDAVRARELRHSYQWLQVCRQRLREVHQQNVPDPRAWRRAVRSWRRQEKAAEQTYNIVAAETEDSVFAQTGLPKQCSDDQ